MYWDLILWDDEEDTDGNYQHIVGAGEVTVEEVEEVLGSHQGRPDDFSDRSGYPLIYGWTSTGKYIVVVYTRMSEEDLIMFRPITAYPVKEYGDLD